MAKKPEPEENVLFPATIKKSEILKRAPDSEAMLEYWDLVDALVGGVTKLRAAGNKFLPIFQAETADDYKERLRLTKFTNIYRDIIESLSEKPFEEEVTLVAPENESVPDHLDTFVEDVDGAGNSLSMFAKNVFFNGVNAALDWIFIDYPKTDPNVTLTREAAKRIGNRPFWSRVLARNVLEAKAKNINGEECLYKMRIHEPGDTDCVRMFFMDDARVVSWALYQEVKNGTVVENYSLIDQGVMDVDCIPLVPFFTGRREGRTFKCKPMMRDAADLSVELYQDESNLKYAKIHTAYPILSGNGVKPEMLPDGKGVKPIARGPKTVLYAPPNKDGTSGGTWTYVEISASSLKFLKEDIKESQRDLREIGRQPLTVQSGNLTVITTAVAAGKSKSAVKSWALNLQSVLETALKITCQWYGDNEYKPSVDVFTEFDEFIDGKDYETLLAIRRNRDMSHETFMYEMKRRGLLGPQYDHAIEESRLLDELPGDELPNEETETQT